MANPSNTPAKLSSGGTLRFYNLLGFSKLYNFILWFITMGYLLGFTLARLEYLSFNGRFCNASSNGVTGAAPGECYYYLQNPSVTFEEAILLIVSNSC
ncbi:hypothetical protein LTR91_018253 [Friedmanniomyces endolithicus]|uniref:Uncharacterized protein n=1 Tax=Friedmanniomyces endolithicus TaxID=329885 RepID=A0AAN6HCU6_9PEZI|nr:hypothetical protein LTR94_002468 [Friedmanniomyces endolithicus]KAK0768316.1 hypothetical protein LTR59_017757 [Friedmanniomyces endolithicus]KAK0772475.1 hypothetical protein LTR38_016882 [Friedmanniomyces endolithicus]KAK0783879.1 hypothetical protein LTR75_014007 [Friedmanniomyces endolithicus]KAK0837558.1 hypothetical protein LTR03_012734 [Friedmanniomyces endolithicus]